MANKIFFPQPVQPVTPGKITEKVKPQSENKNSFSQILEERLNRDIKFSHHARQRLQSRNIELSEADMNKLAEAVGKARDKGARDSLILMNDLALVVSVKNNTVITAVDGQNLKDNVFTNIDSAVIV